MDVYVCRVLAHAERHRLGSTFPPSCMSHSPWAQRGEPKKKSAPSSEGTMEMLFPCPPRPDLEPRIAARKRARHPPLGPDEAVTTDLITDSIRPRPSTPPPTPPPSTAVQSLPWTPRAPDDALSHLSCSTALRSRPPKVSC